MQSLVSSMSPNKNAPNKKHPKGGTMDAEVALRRAAR